QHSLRPPALKVHPLPSVEPLLRPKLSAERHLLVAPRARASVTPSSTPLAPPLDALEAKPVSLVLLSPANNGLKDEPIKAKVPAPLSKIAADCPKSKSCKYERPARNVGLTKIAGEVEASTYNRPPSTHTLCVGNPSDDKSEGCYGDGG
ncbi:hypothetical protein L0F63_000578, partial [Massospora cicadina]